MTALPDGEGYLMAPVLAGMCKLESLLDGTLDLEHIAWANDALAVKAENEARQYKAIEDQRR
jgi:hypothetical protein